MDRHRHRTPVDAHSFLRHAGTSCHRNHHVRERHHNSGRPDEPPGHRIGRRRSDGRIESTGAAVCAAGDSRHPRGRMAEDSRTSRSLGNANVKADVQARHQRKQ
jgi:hypothetical protein